ncbi:MAG: hypothetical protein IMZ71_05135 [Chloroflexi bacterium]|nr:hypothetical protein [Chloroflexota bacterium]
MDKNQPNPASMGSPLPETTDQKAGGPAKFRAPYVYRPRTHPLILLVVMVFYMITTLAWGWQGLPARLVWASLGSLIPLVSMSGLRGEKTRLLRALGVLGALQIAALWVYCIIPATSTSLIESIVSTAFYGYLTVLLVAYLARSQKVDANTIYAAATVFLLLGIAWGYVHHLIELALPGSYTAGMNATDYLYFSFTTLTTTGFGDILALSSLARLATMLEEVMGTLYVAILIGRIVGITVSHAPHHED